jgi:hypothetical protein
MLAFGIELDRRDLVQSVGYDRCSGRGSASVSLFVLGLVIALAVSRATSGSPADWSPSTGRAARSKAGSIAEQAAAVPTGRASANRGPVGRSRPRAAVPSRERSTCGT